MFLLIHAAMGTHSALRKTEESSACRSLALYKLVLCFNKSERWPRAANLKLDFRTVRAARALVLNLGEPADQRLTYIIAVHKQGSSVCT
jgi:hypothetical protein